MPKSAENRRNFADLRRPINRNFTKPEARSLSVSSASSFEQIVEDLKLLPDKYRGSAELREWVRQNKDQKYVPSDLLKAFGFQVDA
jgi:hypothetical protein